MRLRSSSVTAAGSAFNVGLVMENDNANSTLPSSYRRWWHCAIQNLPSNGAMLNVAVSNAGYTDIILPVWSLDGGSTWTRIPSPAPTYSGGTHRFTLATPPGVSRVQLAKWFPYTVTAKDRYLAQLPAHPHLRAITTIGMSAQNRPIQMLELTNSAVPDTSKHRIWVHSGIHPAENTSYFMVEGLIRALLAGSPSAELLLRQAIVNVVPMANPDGVFLGNYRTNARSVNLEEEWTAPYASPEPEIIALRRTLEQFMGTPNAPAANPVAVLLNLHSTHNVSFPFHFQHVANPNFDLVSNRTGVIPAVNALEARWISAIRRRSAFIALGTTQSSTLGAPTRPFVESMMHDRWSIAPTWNRAKVMAITLEGTYGAGPNSAWNVPDDYRRAGAEMVLALGDYLGVLPGGAVTNYGSACGLSLTATLTGSAPARLDLLTTGIPTPPLAALLVGSATWNLPWPPCVILAAPDIVLPLTVDAIGQSRLGLNLPMLPELRAHLQSIAFDSAQLLRTSSGLTVEYAR